MVALAVAVDRFFPKTAPEVVVAPFPVEVGELKQQAVPDEEGRQVGAPGRIPPALLEDSIPEVDDRVRDRVLGEHQRIASRDPSPWQRWNLPALLSHLDEHLPGDDPSSHHLEAVVDEGSRNLSPRLALEAFSDKTAHQLRVSLEAGETPRGRGLVELVETLH